MKYIIEVLVEDGQIQKVTHIQAYILRPISHSSLKEIEEESDGVDTGRTHHRAWQVSDEILILEDKE